MPMARNVAIAAITASPKSSSAENAVKCSEGSTGTIVELNLSSGAASAGLNPQDWNATPEPSTSWSFRMLSSRQSTRCLETKSSYQAQLQLNIASVIRASQATSVENIDEKLMALQQELIQKAQSKEAYDEIADEIFRLRELRQKTTFDTAARDEQIKRINDLQDYIAQQTAHLTEFNESLIRRWVKQITIRDDHITVELKSGVSIDVDA